MATKRELYSHLIDAVATVKGLLIRIEPTVNEEIMRRAKKVSNR